MAANGFPAGLNFSCPWGCFQGCFVVCSWWNVKDLGYLTYYAAEALATGKITGKKGETFAAGRLGERTVGDDGEVILGPAVIVTPENVNSFAF